MYYRVKQVVWIFNSTALILHKITSASDWGQLDFKIKYMDIKSKKVMRENYHLIAFLQFNAEFELDHCYHCLYFSQVVLWFLLLFCSTITLEKKLSVWLKLLALWFWRLNKVAHRFHICWDLIFPACATMSKISFWF
jgi:hypothetical protein